MEQMAQNEKKKHIITGIVVGVAVCLVCTMMYCALLKSRLDEPIKATLMWEHKTNNIVELSRENLLFTELFTCSVPDLKSISMEGEAACIDPNAMLLIEVSEVDTGVLCMQKKQKVSDVFGQNKKIVKWELKETQRDSEQKKYIITIELENPGETCLLLTANQKPGIVDSVNGDTSNKTNIIYAMQYAKTKEISKLFWFLTLLLLLFSEFSYFMIVVKKKTIEQFYIPIALMLGCIVNMVIAVQGVPDEPWHIDTAYKYSNQLLFVGDTGTEGTIYKRTCDVKMQDMLANDVESNSYYQILQHTLEFPKDTELIEVAYTDSGNLVPGVVFLPTAMGISIGRVLGLSAILTLCLGRFMNLLAFVLLTAFAIRVIPVGKNIMGAVGLWPMAMQQGASASYDAIINGIIFLFIAYCIRFSIDGNRKGKQFVIWLLLAGMTAIVKSGVYLPVLILILLYKETREGKKELIGRKNNKRTWLLCILGLVGVVTMLIYRYLPTVMGLLTTQTTGDSKELYSIYYMIKHPLKVIYLYFNTLLDIGDEHLSGLVGGILAWHDVKINWLFIITILICSLLLANVERDKYTGKRKDKLIMLMGVLGSVMLVMMSMLLACTTTDATRIMGLQGRYYLCMAPILLLVSSNRMVCVEETQCRTVWMTLLLSDILVMLQFVVEVI